MASLPPLPVDALVPDLVAALATHRAAVLVAPPGAGKTTRVPPALVCAPFAAGKSVVLLQPRRVAARAAAARIAQEQGWRLGAEVGHHIRFDNRTRPDTRLRVLTEGILTRQIQADASLEGIGCVVLDEFHERSLHTDLALALLREIQTTVREDLRLVVMSATLDPGPVAQFLDDAPVLAGAGRLHPVDIVYRERHDGRPVWEPCAEAVRHALAAGDDAGHVLIFLPGMREIRRTQALLRDVDADVHVLHSAVSDQEQDAALRPVARRKVVLATNIAETSLTIDGVRTVVDTGLVRVLVHDPRLGIDRLELQRVSADSAVQRAGRAGRTAPGYCLRLWTRQEDAALAEHTVPEIRRVDLAGTVLALRAYGVRDLARFGWFDAPAVESLARAERLLELLGAVGPDGTLTAWGRRLAEIPLHPRLAALLLAGAEHGVLREAATLAALLSEKDILADPSAARREDARWEDLSDLFERLALLADNPHAPGLDRAAVRSVLRVRDELAGIVRRTGGAAARGAEHPERELLRALLRAYPDRVTRRRPHDPSRGVMVGGRGVVLEPSSVVRRSAFFLSLDPRDVPGETETRVSLASAVDASWLPELFPHLVVQQVVHRFDEARGRVLSRRETRFVDLVLREEPVGAEADEEGVAHALFAHLRRDVGGLFAADEHAANLLARVRFLRRHMPDLDLPEMDEGALASVLREACAGCRSPREVRLAQALQRQLTQKQRAALDRHAPETLAVPSGSRIRVAYPAGDGPPVVAVRLQEVFGLAETPRLAAGRAPVLLQLLGPNFRPVQITADLASFWNSTYAEVRKELRARYPKHPWPDDPWKARPTAVGGRRRR